MITRTPETSESATNRFSPSVASPLGWAKLAEAVVPSLIFSDARSGEDTDRFRARVELPDLVRAGHGDIDRLVAGEAGSRPRGCKAASFVAGPNAPGCGNAAGLAADARDRGHRAAP